MDLPPEILQIIFSLCSEEDLLESVQFVCRKWHESVFSLWVWKHKILTVPRNKNCQKLKSQLIELPFLKNVWLLDEKCMRYDALSLLYEYCPLLEYLRVDSCHIQLCMNQLSKFSCLTYIDLNFQTVKYWHHELEKPDYRFPPLLRTIIFRNSFANASLLPFIFQSCKFLQHFVISNVNDLESFLELSLKNSGSKDKVVKQGNLLTLYISFSTAIGINHCFCEFSKFCNLKHLALKSSRVSNRDMRNIVFKKNHPDLVFLDLSYSLALNTITFESIIKTCPNLVYLSLRRSNVTDRTLLAILTFLPQLQYLDLHGTLISSQHFPSIPHKLPKLLDLNVCACRGIDQHHLNDLVTMMPNLIIVNTRRGHLKGAHAMERHHSFLENRNSLDFSN